IKTSMSPAIDAAESATPARTTRLNLQRAGSAGDISGTSRYSAPHSAGGPKKNPSAVACAAESAKPKSGGSNPLLTANRETATIAMIKSYTKIGTPNNGV